MTGADHRAAIARLVGQRQPIPVAAICLDLSFHTQRYALLFRWPVKKPALASLFILKIYCLDPRIV